MGVHVHACMCVDRFCYTDQLVCYGDLPSLSLFLSLSLTYTHTIGQPLEIRNPDAIKSNTINDQCRIQCVSAMKEYEAKSLEVRLYVGIFRRVQIESWKHYSSTLYMVGIVLQ